ncbi:integrase [Paracoccaceae bacterium]|nr:integrase [Paracoccaceae bacterium]
MGKSDDEAIFPRYARAGGSDSASAAMLKRFRKVKNHPKKALHSLRHRKKDQLRNVSCPEEISKALLGHSNQDVAARYGSGYSIEVLRDWMAKTW